MGNKKDCLFVVFFLCYELLPCTIIIGRILIISSPDLLPPHPLHPPCASEESALLHRSSDDPADHPLCVRDVPSALHEDGVPSPDDTAGSYSVS